jgi:lipoprotein-anchoring transpeptidase ErfK/SrfK
MQPKLGRVAALVVLSVVVGATFATAVAASPPDDTSTTTTTPTTTTTTAAPLVADMPTQTPRRGEPFQLTDTIPPPPTTTTLPPTALPANSGEGRRVVYSKPRQRVWTVESDGSVSKTHAVSGRLTWNQPPPGTYHVFSRSANTCNIKKPYLCWRYMIRFTVGPDGDNIGFHEIPIDTRTGRPVQDLSQLGSALSNGCVRQAPADALYMWNWAPVGTKVVVLG